MAQNAWESVRDDVMKTLGRIDANLESLVGLQKEMKDDHKSLEYRVSTLEKSWQWVLGAAAAVAAAVNYLPQFVHWK